MFQCSDTEKIEKQWIANRLRAVTINTYSMIKYI